eukprot:2531731-Amphidinium_carterae.1
MDDRAVLAFHSDVCEDLQKSVATDVTAHSTLVPCLGGHAEPCCAISFLEAQQPIVVMSSLFQVPSLECCEQNLTAREMSLMRVSNHRASLRTSLQALALPQADSVIKDLDRRALPNELAY